MSLCGSSRVGGDGSTHGRKRTCTWLDSSVPREAEQLRQLVDERAPFSLLHLAGHWGNEGSLIHGEGGGSDEGFVGAVFLPMGPQK